jgi:uncharacterized protein (UPF0335 family)
MNTNSELQSIAANITRLDNLIDDYKEERKAAYEIAASKGYNAKALRKAIKVSSMDAKQRDRHDNEQGDLLRYLEEIEGEERRDAA